jgi:L-ascorbate metabolism protein UlaG (beta-lactamase superfamily)
MIVPDRRQIEPPEDLDDQDRVVFLPHKRGKRFFNPWKQTKMPGAAEILKWKAGRNPFAEEKRRQKSPDVARDGLQLLGAAKQGGMVWIGHASFLVEVDGFRVLIDPVFGSAGTVVPREVPPPFELEELPEVDAVLITHGHYDHLERSVLRRLGAGKEGLPVVVPLGLGRHVPRSCPNVIEVDWWDVLDFGGVEVAFLPAQHWHRRTLTDTNRALWGGYVIRGTRKVYHIGDSGYFPGFRAAGRIFEGFDAAILPVGAFEPRWFMHPQHMNPTESLKAFEDLQAEIFVGMHWGTFDLTDEPFFEGPKRVRALVAEQQIDPERVKLPIPGGFVAL